MSDHESLGHGATPVAIGEVLANKYRVDRILGMGGMGVVVQATHLQLAQRVALKFMLPVTLNNQALIERFTREARAMVRLRSDHVARVLDVGTLESGSPYIVMEYLEGNDLGMVLQEGGPLSPEAAVDCLLQACDAIAEAHALGIVHRDLKPRNLFLTYRNDGRPLVKLLDFGISKQLANGDDLSLTGTSEIIGSPNYMSPEQFTGARAADERSDIWALGVILYELVTAKVPFVAKSVSELTAMVLTEPPRPIQAVRENVPAEFARVVEHCLQKDPAARYQSIAELALALQPFAPPDARDLAGRIGRIGTASIRSVASEAARASAGGSREGRTTAAWIGAVVRASSMPGGSRTTALALAAVVFGAGVISARLALLGRATPTVEAAAQSSTQPPVAPEEATFAPSARVLAPVATLAPAPEPIQHPPPASTLAPPPEPTAPLAAPAKPVTAPLPLTAPVASGSPVRVTTRGRPDAGGTGAGDGPRYRTNW